MELPFIKIGQYFINLNNLLWAEVEASPDHPESKMITLIYARVDTTLTLRLTDDAAQRLVYFLESTSRWL